MMKGSKTTMDQILRSLQRLRSGAPRKIKSSRSVQTHIPARINRPIAQAMATHIGKLPSQLSIGSCSDLSGGPR